MIQEYFELKIFFAFFKKNIFSEAAALTNTLRHDRLLLDPGQNSTMTPVVLLAPIQSRQMSRSQELGMDTKQKNGDVWFKGSYKSPQTWHFSVGGSWGCRSGLGKHLNAPQSPSHHVAKAGWEYGLKRHLNLPNVCTNWWASSWFVVSFRDGHKSPFHESQTSPLRHKFWYMSQCVPFSTKDILGGCIMQLLYWSKVNLDLSCTGLRDFLGILCKSPLFVWWKNTSPGISAELPWLTESWLRF